MSDLERRFLDGGWDNLGVHRWNEVSRVRGASDDDLYDLGFRFDRSGEVTRVPRVTGG